MTARRRQATPRGRSALLRLAGTGLLAALLLAGCSSGGPRTAGSTSSGPAGSTATATTPPATGASGTTTTVAGPAVRPISWSSCDGMFECGTLPVPISYRDASEGTIDLSVVELPAVSAHPIADVVLNPGGPGASGVAFLEQGWSQFSALHQDFTLVSFDPRGIGGSSPVVCEPPAGIRALLALPPVPETAGQVAEVVAATKRFVAGCAASVSRDVLANLSTADTARDLDRLRQALGQRRLTYFGYSYGTFLGATYAQLFPTHVRAMVLDGVFDPSISTVALETQQAEAFETDLHDFLAWCGRNSSCGPISASGHPEATFEQLMGRFAAGMTEPATLPADFGGDERVDYGIAELGVLTGMYSPDSWQSLGQALTLAEEGDGTDLAYFADEYAGQQQDGSFQNIVSAEAAISCLDRSSPSGLATYERLAAQLGAVAPDFGGAEAWGSLICSYWPVPPTSEPFDVHAPGLPPVLVVGSTHDPATPYRWAEALVSQLPGSVLLTRTGDGHTAYSFSTCIQGWVNRYLTTLSLPPAGTVCASDAGLPS